MEAYIETLEEDAYRPPTPLVAAPYAATDSPPQNKKTPQRVAKKLPPLKEWNVYTSGQKHSHYCNCIDCYNKKNRSI